MRKVPVLLLLLLLLPTVSAAPTIPDPGAVREQAIVETIQAENEKTREHITAFGEDTHEMYLQERAKAEKEIDQTLTKFKFTVAITLFFTMLAALEAHSLLKKRREKKYKQPTIAEAEKIQDGMPQAPKPPPGMKQ